MSNADVVTAWEICRLDDVAAIVRGVTFPTDVKSYEPANGMVACLRTANVQSDVEWDDLWFIPREYIKNEEQYVRQGDVLISTANSYELVGKVARVKTIPQIASLGAFISLLRAERGISDRYFYYLMSSEDIQRAIRAKASTTTNLSNVSGAKLKEIQLPIAPESEQTRIVEKLEELLSDLDAGVAELKAAQRKLAQYRQSLLKAAVEGALTADWRAARSASSRRKPGSSRSEDDQHRKRDPGLRRDDEAQETGAELLQRILRERRARWEQKQLAKFTEQGKAPPKDWQDKYREPTAPDLTDASSLPQGWAWATVDQLASVGTGVTPLRSKKSYFEGGDIPWTTSGALNEEMVTSPSEYVTKLAVAECRLDLYPVGTLLVAMYGEGKTRGKCAELTFPSTINQAIAAIVLEGEAIEVSAHLKTFFLDAYEAMRKQASGGVQPNLNLQIIKTLCIPLPPLSEQVEIQARLEEQLADYRQLKDSTSTAIEQSIAQRKNILKAAFSGQLVPQDPNDEPARELLARIRAAREQAPTARSKGRRAGSNPAPATNAHASSRKPRKAKERA